MDDPLVDDTPRFSRINAANHEIDVRVLGDLLDLRLHALPVKPPEEVDPVCQNYSFWESDFRPAKWLSDTVGFADCVGINQRNLQAARMAEGQHGLGEGGHSGT